MVAPHLPCRLAPEDASRVAIDFGEERPERFLGLKTFIEVPLGVAIRTVQDPVSTVVTTPELGHHMLDPLTTIHERWPTFEKSD